MYSRCNNAPKETPLQQKLNKNSISDHTKKLMTKVYEIDLVPFTTPTMNATNNSMKENKSFMRSSSSNSSVFKSQNFGNSANSNTQKLGFANSTKNEKQG